MKTVVIIFLCACLFGLMACHEEDGGYYTGDSYIQFYAPRPGATYNVQAAYSVGMNYSKIFTLGPKKNRDTVYFRVHSIGQLSDKKRQVKFEQFSLENEISAEAGVDYVAFDDPEVMPLMCVQADSAFANIPIIIKYNAEKTTDKTGYKPVNLHFRLVPTEDYALGTSCFLTGILQFSNSQWY